MNIEQVIFYILSLIAIGSGVYVVTSQQLVRSIFMFFVTLLSVAGLYIFALADFVALTQIVVYVGGVLVLLLFAFMLSSKNSLDEFDSLKREALSANRFPATIICLSIVGILIYMILQIDFSSLKWIENALAIGNVKTPAEVNVTNIGINLMTKYLLPLEVICIFLMMVLVGAAHLARKEGQQ